MFHNRVNCCYMTRTAYLIAIYRATLSLHRAVKRSIPVALEPGYVWLRYRDELLSSLSGELRQHIQVPGALQFLELSAKCLLELSTTLCDPPELREVIVMTTLTSDLYEVRQLALRHLANHTRRESCDLGVYDNMMGDGDSEDEVSRSNITIQSCDLIPANQSVFNELVAMVFGKEPHPDCFVIVSFIIYYCITLDIYARSPHYYNDSTVENP